MLVFLSSAADPVLAGDQPDTSSHYLPVKTRRGKVTSEKRGRAPTGSPPQYDTLPSKPPDLVENTPRYHRQNYGVALGVTQNVGLTGSNGAGGFYPANGYTQSGGNSSRGVASLGVSGARAIVGTGSTSSDVNTQRDVASVDPTDLYPWLYDTGPTDTGTLGDPTSFGGPLNSTGGDAGTGGGARVGGGAGGFGASTSTILTARGGYLATDSLGFSLGVTQLFPEGQGLSGSVGGLTGGNGFGASGGVTTINGGTSYKATDWMRVSINLMQYFQDSGTSANIPIYTSPAYSGSQFGGPNGYVPDSTIATLSTDFRLSRYTNLNLTIPYGFQNGIQDPSASLRLRYPLFHARRQDLLLIAGVAATAPLSQVSQQEGKITTLTAQLGPTYRYARFSLGVTDTFAYTFYNPNASAAGYYYSPNGPDNPFGGYGSYPFALGGSYSRAPQLYRNSTGGTIGYRFTKEIRVTSSAGVNYTYNQDSSYSWGTFATVANLTYSPGAWTLSASFSLFSNPQNNQSITFPTLPVVGISAQYLFGDRTALTGGAPGGLGGGGGGLGGGRR